MELEAVRAYGLTRAGAAAEYPFGPQPLVLKVGGRIFAIIAEEAEPATISLKCEPEVAPALREAYPSVAPGYHLNKRHWNTVTLDGTVPADELMGWIDDSYDLVVDQLPRHVQQALGWSPP